MGRIQNMSREENPAEIETESIEGTFQKRIAPLLVILFSATVLWPMGIINLQIAEALLLLSIIYPLMKTGVNSTLEEFGIRFSKIRQAIRKNWFLILSPVVVVAPIDHIVMWFFPEYSEHIINRIPIELTANPIYVLLVIVIIGPLVEEALFRGFLQKYITFFAPKVVSVILASVVFALWHWAVGDVFIVFLDITFLFIRGCLYGLIFLRTDNALISFMAHALVNLPFW
jgi:membrane protease YdiL (CAAX protease family)